MSVIRNYIIAALALMTATGSGATDFSRGRLLVCEGQYGADYGSIAFFGEDGSSLYRAFSSQNPGSFLGTTSQSGCVHNRTVYVVSKDAIGGGFITAMDATTLNFKGSLNELPGHVQAFYLNVVSSGKGYLSTSEGLYIIDLENMEVRGRVSGNGLSSGMFGQSLLHDDKLFVVSRRDGVVVIDSETDGVLRIIPVSGASAIACSDNGTIYVGTTDSAGEIVEISAKDFSTHKIDIDGSIAAMTDIWESWALQPFVFNATDNAILLAGRYSSTVGRYDIVNGDFVPDFIRLPEASGNFNNVLYGQGISLNPYDGTVSVITAEAVGDYFNDCFRIYSADASTGAIIPDRTIELPEGYWFPAQMLYPSMESSGIEPVVNDTELKTAVFTPDGRIVLPDAGMDEVMSLPCGIYIFGGRKIVVR